MRERASLGELEEMILLTVGVLFDQAYSVAIKDELEQRQQRKISLGAMHTALYRLERKGHLESRLGESTKVRGGKPKRYFRVTPLGQTTLQQLASQREQLWGEIKPVAFSSIIFDK